MKWPKKFDETELKLNLFGIYIYTEIGGTGGGSFRYMYSRFLKEAAAITSEKGLLDISKSIYKSGEIFTKIGLLFKDILEEDIGDKIPTAAELYLEIADIEEEAFTALQIFAD